MNIAQIKHNNSSNHHHIGIAHPIIIYRCHHRDSDKEGVGWWGSHGISNISNSPDLDSFSCGEETGEKEKEAKKRETILI